MTLRQYFMMILPIKILLIMTLLIMTLFLMTLVIMTIMTKLVILITGDVIDFTIN
jgi:hypothetical protein